MRDTLLKDDRAGVARIHAIVPPQPDTIGGDGNNVSIRWTVDATDKKGVTRRLNEIALQTWLGDRIASERFIYDTATAWQIISASET